MVDSAARAKAATDRIYKALDHPDELAEVTARALLDAAQAAASSRPTPQAPMVAAGFTVDNSLIRGPQVGTLADILMGSEFGSTRYAQFHGKHPQGSWLLPTIDDPPATVETEQGAWLDKVIRG